MFDDYNAKLNQMAMQAPMGPGQMYKPQTKRERLEQKRKEVAEMLRRVEAALEALDNYPELETFINVLQEAGE